MIKFGRFPNKSVPELAAESILLALDDANLTMGDIHAFTVETLKKLIGWLVKRLSINWASNYPVI